MKTDTQKNPKEKSKSRNEKLDQLIEVLEQAKRNADEANAALRQLLTSKKKG